MKCFICGKPMLEVYAPPSQLAWWFADGIGQLIGYVHQCEHGDVIAPVLQAVPCQGCGCSRLRMPNSRCPCGYNPDEDGPPLLDRRKRPVVSAEDRCDNRERSGRSMIKFGTV